MTGTKTLDDLDTFLSFPLIGKLKTDEPVAVALSGGPDSMALCFILSQKAQTQNGPVIHALIVDHGLRPESAAEDKKVHDWAQKFPFVEPVILTRRPDQAAKTRIMEQARDDRYALLAGYCHDHGIAKLFVGHHADDQAETMLFRLAKGSGLDGLAGMAPVRAYDETLDILRPLLPSAKDDLLELCATCHIPYVEDPSNRNDRYARPRMRQILSLLKKEGFSTKRLEVTAKRLSDARDALDFYALQTFRAALVERGAEKICLDYAVLEEAPAEIRLRVMIAATKDMKNDEEKADSYGIRRDRLENLASDLFKKGSFRRRTLGGFVFSRQNRHRYVCIEREQR